MKITVTRSGGFAGLTETIANVDTATLDAVRARAAERLVEELRFFSLPEALPAAEIGADILRYDITVIDQNRRHTVHYTEGNSASQKQLQRLIDAVAPAP